MQQWKKRVLKLAIQADNKLDKAMLRLRQRLGQVDPMQIVPYRSYGTADKIFVRGRVLEDKKIAVKETDQLFANLLNMYKRFETDEVPNAKVLLHLHGQTVETVTDKEGYFKFSLDTKTPIVSDELYFTLPLTLQSKELPTPVASAAAEMMIPPADSEYGIISDIDDTIIRTGATS